MINMGERVMKQKLLVIDDEQGIVDLLKSYFSAQYEVLTAYSGSEALAKVSGQPDLILLDINMPGMDGLSVCRQIREYVTCPILFLTARIESADQIMGFQAGADDYIVKPFDLDELGARVAAHLKLKREWFVLFLLLLSLLPVLTGGASALFNDSTKAVADLFFFMNNQFAMFFPMVIFILIGSLFYQEYKNKTYITWITYGYAKAKLFLAKMIVSMVSRCFDNVRVERRFLHRFVPLCAGCRTFVHCRSVRVNERYRHLLFLHGVVDCHAGAAPDGAVVVVDGDAA